METLDHCHCRPVPGEQCIDKMIISVHNIHTDQPSSGKATKLIWIVFQISNYELNIRHQTERSSHIQTVIDLQQQAKLPWPCDISILLQFSDKQSSMHNAYSYHIIVSVHQRKCEKDLSNKVSLVIIW